MDRGIQVTVISSNPQDKRLKPLKVFDWKSLLDMQAAIPSKYPERMIHFFIEIWDNVPNFNEEVDHSFPLLIPSVSTFPGSPLAPGLSMLTGQKTLADALTPEEREYVRRGWLRTGQAKAEQEEREEEEQLQEELVIIPPELQSSFLSILHQPSNPTTTTTTTTTSTSNRWVDVVREASRDDKVGAARTYESAKNQDQGKTARDYYR